LALAGRTVHGDGLLHEDVELLLDGVGEVYPAEGRWGGEDRDITRPQAIHRLLVRVEADEPPTFGHVHLVPMPFFQVLVAVGKPMLEGVGHGNELDRASFDGHGVRGGPGPAAAAADEGQLNRVVLAGIHPGGNPRRQRRDCRQPAAVFEELAA
jgi:hypothetical protein